MDYKFKNILDSIQNRNYNRSIQKRNNKGGAKYMAYTKLRNIRNSQGISAKEMAELLGLKTEAAYYKKENGAIKFSVSEAKIIADRLGMKIEEIFFENKVSLRETG